MIRYVMILGALAILAACGNSPRATVGQSVASAITNLSQARAQTVDARDLIDRATIDALTGPVLLVGVENRDAFGTFVVTRDAGDLVTWSGADGTTLTLRNGFVIATRGLGSDLMYADPPMPLDGGGRLQRRFEHLNAENRTVGRRFMCEVGPRASTSLILYERRLPVTFVKERCSDGVLSFENEFWFQANGTLVQSRQWIGQHNAYLFLQPLGN